MFGVPGQTVRAWASGETAVPERYVARISQAHGRIAEVAEACEALLEYWR
jgi:hypothetical protein